MKATTQLANRLVKVALAYPEAWEDDPWGDRVVKVRKKIFLFCGLYEKNFHCTVKLPESAGFALTFDWTEPAGYGLGKAGWVSVRVPVNTDIAADLLEEWIDESYRAVAPKTLVKQLDTQ